MRELRTVAACVIVGGLGALAWAEGPAQPVDSAEMGGGELVDDGSLLRDRAEEAARTVEDFDRARWCTYGLASLALLAGAGLVWWVSTSWVGGPFFQWLLLLALPLPVVGGVSYWYAGGLQAQLGEIPGESLDRIARDPVLSAEPELVSAAHSARRLKIAAARGRLVLAAHVAGRPAWLGFATAVLLCLVIWDRTNRALLRGNITYGSNRASPAGSIPTV